MAKSKKSISVVAQVQPQPVSISHCTFTGDSVPMTEDRVKTILALSSAIEVNAHAAWELAHILKGPDALLKIGRMD